MQRRAEGVTAVIESPHGTSDGYQETAPVGSFPEGASWVGALDMAGNVYEWTHDWYSESYYGQSPSRNPTGPASGERHSRTSCRTS